MKKLNRKGFSQTKINNSNFRQSMKLKNSHLFTPSTKSKNRVMSPFSKIKKVNN